MTPLLCCSPIHNSKLHIPQTEFILYVCITRASYPCSTDKKYSKLCPAVSNSLHFLCYNVVLKSNADSVVAHNNNSYTIDKNASRGQTTYTYRYCCSITADVINCLGRNYTRHTTFGGVHYCLLIKQEPFAKLQNYPIWTENDPSHCRRSKTIIVATWLMRCVCSTGGGSTTIYGSPAALGETSLTLLF